MPETESEKRHLLLTGLPDCRLVEVIPANRDRLVSALFGSVRRRFSLP